MFYYLINQNKEDLIYIVRRSEKKKFLNKMAGKIVYSADNILELLPRIHIQPLRSFEERYN